MVCGMEQNLVIKTELIAKMWSKARPQELQSKMFQQKICSFSTWNADTLRYLFALIELIIALLANEKIS